MLKEVLYWTDKKFEEVVENPNEKHPYIKAFGLGALEGFLEGCTIIGGFVVALSIASTLVKKPNE